MEQRIDWQAALNGSRPVTTRDGRKVTLYCVDAPGEWPVHGRVEGTYQPSSWGLNGCVFCGSHSSRDLIQPPRRFKYEGWVNVYADMGGSILYPTQEDASLMHLTGDRIACVKVVIEGEEGEGLE